jgi:hypothetical protein
VKRAVPRPEDLLFTRRKKVSSMKQEDLRDIFNKASKSVCTPTTVVSPDHLSPMPSTYSITKTPGNTAKDPDDPKPADK